MKGLGDLVEIIIIKTLKPLGSLLRLAGYRVYPPLGKHTKRSCGGCAARKAMLNKVVPFNKNKETPEGTPPEGSTK